ncbi:putative sensor histidine kinase TcrY [Meiothermus luteus]|jgi:signal transduction histidine kinase|uniref:histidine kinase n=1 Tax=Meiothermus luteus TaxID=2026184 RepID=A0A399F1D0_9DEIN|nr:HAMP domain-containing sensor histidine kinase [Meiothermus luteus]RIH88612.1 putative sensor histidine kinase TcrY [Meiothermus luteus]RMH57480.1 MAG: HAMP domain-containing protein [Deinococcota bacterium]
MTLRTRITLLTLGLLFVLQLLIGGSVYGTLQFILYENLRRELVEASQTAQRLIREQGSLEGLPFTVYGQALWVPFPNPTASDILQGAAIPIAKSLALDGASLTLSEKALQEVLRLGGIYTETTLLRRDGAQVPLRLRAERIETEIAGIPQGPQLVILMVGRSTEGIRSTLADFARTYAATALLVLVFGGFLAFRLVRQTLEPLEWVAKKAEQMSAKPERLPELMGNNEVASLVKSLNRMLARLEAAWETQGRFLADASHELRTPITAILGHINYLLRRTQVSEQQRESLEIIKREAERMQKLVGDLLELSKTGGGWKVELGAVHLQTVLNEIQEEYSKSFEGQIEIEAPEDLWVLGDAERLHQVLANLVSNAIKAHARRVRLVVRDLDERVVLRVEDDGDGIPKEHLPHLFERFYRVDKARDRERGGSGLGLAIVRSIVEAHGGSVWVESEPGRGSVFSVSLRRARAPQTQLA